MQIGRVTDLRRLGGNIRTYLSIYLTREGKMFNDSARHPQMIYENDVKL